MIDTTTLAAKLAQALADAAHFRQLVAEEKIPADALHVVEYHAASLRRRLADLQANRPSTTRQPTTDRSTTRRPPTDHRGRGGRILSPRDAQYPRGSTASLPDGFHG